MSDFQVLSSDFAAVTSRVVCASKAAKERHNGAASLDIRKSTLPDFLNRMQAEGFSFALAS
jgi:hypothetical protein